MPAYGEQYDEFAELLTTMSDVGLDVPQGHRLAQLMRADSAAEQRYLDFIRLHTMLVWQYGPKPEEKMGSDLTPFSPAAGFLNTTLHGAIGYFPEGMPLAYLIATVITGLGILIASHIYMSPPEQIARQSAPLPSPLPPFPSVVGKITGMVDCTWENVGWVKRSAAPPGLGASPKTQDPRPKTPIALGDRFALSSGLMEITYDTGAKVILQGPATYQVESNGGYLAVGKLTGRLETKTQDPSPKTEEDIHPSSFILHPFSIRTPTATVTDLGTEFGVEVDRTGVTESHVFRGAVRIELTSTAIGNELRDRAVVVGENESACVEKQRAADNGLQTMVIRKVAKPGHFVRSLPLPEKPSPLHVLAWFRMGEDDPGATAGQPACEVTINHGHRYHLKKYGSPTYAADTAAPGSERAMSFSGTEGEYFYNRYLGWAPDDNFIFEAWARPNRAMRSPRFVAFVGRGWTDGYGLALLDGQWRCCWGPGFWPEPGVPCEFGKWTHLAFVREHGIVQFWVNGRLARNYGDQAVVLLPCGALSIGRAPKEICDVPNAFDGQIDEVRISELLGPFDPKMLLFSATAERRH